MAPDPWFSTYDSTCQIAQEIAEKVQQRNQYERNGENTTKLTVTIRALLQKLKEKIALLKDLLLRAVATHQITQLEGDRRQNLLDDLVTRERLLLASFKNEGAEPDLIRSSLMTGGAKRGAPNPWLLEEPEETRGLGFDEIRQQQQKIIQEQDAGLDALSSIISRQKQMGQEIGNELDEQNEIIDDLANLVENTDEKLRTETRRVNLVDRKSTSCERGDSLIVKSVGSRGWTHIPASPFTGRVTLGNPLCLDFPISKMGIIMPSQARYFPWHSPRGPYSYWQMRSAVMRGFQKFVAAFQH
ncbi:syntaxin-8 isoform X1 [Cervus elaphus]|uniref:syntaxin-8 isoform X1 n=1 Tax=Cervus elaphus TaxID=9860 RepID=UPI001CC288C5|nr:syntaxin-8 isoform X1 [Cervus elaphus]